MQIFFGEETPSTKPATASTEKLDLLVPKRRIEQVQDNTMSDQPGVETSLSLQEQLDERTAQLQASQEQLMKSNRDFQEFATAVSHDLQAPLRAIAGFSQFLQQEYAGSLDETSDQYIDHIVSGATRMRNLIEGLLQFSRVSSRGKSMEELSLNDVLDQVLVDLQGEISTRNVVVQCGDLPNIFGDYDQLKCLFRNLIHNGFTFNESDNPEISIRAEQVKTNLHVIIEDNGIGIAEKNIDKVFSIFRRLHTQEQYNGVGVGLAVARRIVNRHGGVIQLSSELGFGTKATIIFPSTVSGTEPVC